MLRQIQLRWVALVSWLLFAVVLLIRGDFRLYVYYDSDVWWVKDSQIVFDTPINELILAAAYAMGLGALLLLVRLVSRQRRCTIVAGAGTIGLIAGVVLHVHGDFGVYWWDGPKLMCNQRARQSERLLWSVGCAVATGGLASGLLFLTTQLKRGVPTKRPSGTPEGLFKP